MKKKLSGLSLVVFMMFTFAMNAAGQEAKPEPKGEPKPEAKPAFRLEEIKNLLGLSVYLQGGYTYNFRDPDSMTNEQRIFDRKANTFLIDLAQVQLAKDPAVGGLGFKLKVSAGETAKFIHSAGLGSPNDEFDLTEADVDYVAPLGSGLKLRFGKFVTYHSAEVIEAKDNFLIIHAHSSSTLRYRLLTRALWQDINSLRPSPPTSTSSTGGMSLLIITKGRRSERVLSSRQSIQSS